MALLKDITGQRFGKLVVIQRGPNTKTQQAQWICRCDCDPAKTTLVAGTTLRYGTSNSCGCNRKDAAQTRVIDMVGKTFGRLTVLARDGSNPDGKARWKCVCICGNETTVTGRDLRNGHTASCDCWRVDTTKERATTHAMSKTREYKSWKAAKQRCINPNDGSYSDYGARGITMADEWMDSFEAFYEHIGPRPKGTSLDRIDNQRGYEPGNVRWTTIEEQNNNRRPRRWHKRQQSR